MGDLELTYGQRELTIARITQFGDLMSGHLITRISSAFILTILGMMPFAWQVAAAQTKPAIAVPVVMLSDLHFDPFHDPAKVPILVKAPVDQWQRILSTPDSSNQAEDFAAIQKGCKAKEGTDTPYALLDSSLLAAQAKAPSASFVTVSGDLLVHDLDCRYRAAMKLDPSSNDDQFVSAGFAEKTTVFVMKQVESTFPHIPVYLALGNNDSRCNHNRLDTHDAYLKTSASSVIEGLRGVSVAEKKAAFETYESAGYYAVTMPAPMTRTRLIVIDDIYMMPKYANCEADEQDQNGAQEQMVWLQKQLESSRRNGDRVWLLGHLPPTVNPESSLAEGDHFCASGKVTRFQTTDDLAVAMMDYTDILKLGIFGHTHMDELHLLRSGPGGVPVKVVGSISPVSGNLPSFTVGLVNPDTSKLADYTVYESSNSTGVQARWSKEYAFDEAYHEPDFSPESLADLIARLHSDAASGSQESRSYQAHFLKGSSGKKLSSSWPGYVCSLDNPTAKGFKACVCGGR
jgi:sphingomyelin phosphodiesterase acid-like 3